MKERSSSLLVQEVRDIKNHNFDYFTILQYQMAEDLEKLNHYSVVFTQNLIGFYLQGLFKRAANLLKAPPLESDGGNDDIHEF